MISEHAIVHPSAKIGPNVHIGPWTLIGPEVEIGEGSRISSHVVVNGPTIMGNDNQVFQFASIGEAPQDKKYGGEPTRLAIGDRNIFRECSTIHRGTTQGGDFTRIGSDNLFMAYSHVAHDCQIGNHVIFSNNASIAGHVKVGDYASLGGLVGVHQNCAIGTHSFLAAGSIILRDVPPFLTVAGYPANAHGLNTVGLERRGYSPSAILALKQAYKIVFRQNLTLKEALAKLQELRDLHAEVQTLCQFLELTERGIIR